MVEVTAKEEGRVNIGRKIKMEHCFEVRKHMSQPKGGKHQIAFSATLRIEKEIT